MIRASDVSGGHSSQYLSELGHILSQIDPATLDALAETLRGVRDRKGRVFCLGNGGSAANAEHAATDLRHTLGIEAYASHDNSSELTARVNDLGWAASVTSWLQCSQLRREDMVWVFSTSGGGPTSSANLAGGLAYARETGCTICSIVGRPGGVGRQLADIACVVPADADRRGKGLTETVQLAIVHLLANHPMLTQQEARTSSIAENGKFAS